jgi:hypothetical protein
MNQFQKNPDFPERPCFLAQSVFCRFLGLSKGCLRSKLKAAGEPPLGRLVSPERQKRVCKIVGVPYFFPDEK